MSHTIKEKLFQNSKRGAFFATSLLVMVVLVVGAASYAYSQLKSPEIKQEEISVDHLTSKERQKNTVPVNPEGFACRAYTDYLDASGKIEPEKTPEETYKKVESLQEPVKEKVDEVEDSDFRKPFNDYFENHKDYTFDMLEGNQNADGEKMELILNEIVEKCSTPEATETVPVKK